MTIKEIYHLRHIKTVGFNTSRKRVIEQLLSQRGECTYTAVYSALRDELDRISAEEQQMNIEMNALLREELSRLGMNPQIAEKVFLYPKARIFDCCEGMGWFVSKCLDSIQEVEAQQNILRKVNAENED